MEALQTRFNPSKTSEYAQKHLILINSDSQESLPNKVFPSKIKSTIFTPKNKSAAFFKPIAQTTKFSKDVGLETLIEEQVKTITLKPTVSIQKYSKISLNTKRKQSEHVSTVTSDFFDNNKLYLKSAI